MMASFEPADGTRPSIAPRDVLPTDGRDGAQLRRECEVRKNPNGLGKRVPSIRFSFVQSTFVFALLSGGLTNPRRPGADGAASSKGRDRVSGPIQQVHCHRDVQGPEDL